jgi:hypothetical protein
MSFIRSSIAAVALFSMESLLNVLLRIRILAQGFPPFHRPAAEADQYRQILLSSLPVGQTDGGIFLR